MSPLLAGVLGAVSWHGAFAVYLIGLPLGIAVWRSMPRSAAAGQPGTAGSQERTSLVALLRARPTLLALYAVMFMIGVMIYVPAVFLPGRLAEVGITSTVLVAH